MRGGTGQTRFRGQPILVLALLAIGWTGLRIATWASPLPEDYARPAAAESVSTIASAVSGGDEQAGLAQPDAGSSGKAKAGASDLKQPALLPPVSPPSVLPDGGWNDPLRQGGASVRPAAPEATDAAQDIQPVPLAANGLASERPARMRMAAGHTLLMAAGFSNMELPPEIAVFFERALRQREASAGSANLQLAANASPAAVDPADATRPAAPVSSASRWSGDGWLMWRQDTTTPITSGRPSYGRSQAGAVVRYQLAPGSRNRPQAYLRASASIEGASEQEVAAGLSARPLARVPIRLAAEMRVSNRAQGQEVRPAAYAVTELAPQQLPGGLQAQVYAQAGYVGGEVATGFVDGQARIDANLASAGDFDLRAGAAVWGGAQRDGERLDVGPSASLTFRMGEARGRLAADYRFRVAGDAEPASGPALTLSAGF